MTALAMCFPGILRWRAKTTHNINSQSDQFYMGRIYAMADTAQMINTKTIGNWSIDKRPCDTMSLHVGIAAIPCKRNTSLPQPTTIGFDDVAPELFNSYFG